VVFYYNVSLAFRTNLTHGFEIANLSANFAFYISSSEDRLTDSEAIIIFDEFEVTSHHARLAKPYCLNLRTVMPH